MRVKDELSAFVGLRTPNAASVVDYVVRVSERVHDCVCGPVNMHNAASVVDYVVRVSERVHDCVCGPCE